MARVHDIVPGSAIDDRERAYSSDRSTVTIEIAPLRRGCELTLTHEMTEEQAPYRERGQEGWRGQSSTWRASSSWTLVKGQSQVLALLRIAADRDETMLASMMKPD